MQMRAACNCYQLILMQMHAAGDNNVGVEPSGSGSSGNIAVGGAGGDGGNNNGNNANGGDFNSGDNSGNGGIAFGNNGNGGAGGTGVGGKLLCAPYGFSYAYALWASCGIL